MRIVSYALALPCLLVALQLDPLWAEEVEFEEWVEEGRVREVRNHIRRKAFSIPDGKGLWVLHFRYPSQARLYHAKDRASNLLLSKGVVYWDVRRDSLTGETTILLAKDRARFLKAKLSREPYSFIRKIKTESGTGNLSAFCLSPTTDEDDCPTKNHYHHYDIKNDF